MPPLVALVVTLVLTAVRVILALTLRVAVPLVLTLLSLVFGRGLLRAARAVRAAGRRAGEAVRDARTHILQPRLHHPDRAPSPPNANAPAATAEPLRAEPAVPEAKPVRIATDRPSGQRIEAPPADATTSTGMTEAIDEIEDAVAEATRELRRHS